MQTPGLEAVQKERLRQIYDLGWSKENDKQYTQKELVNAAAYYMGIKGIEWPFTDWPAPEIVGGTQGYTKAASLLIAELDRLYSNRKDLLNEG